MMLNMLITTAVGSLAQACVILEADDFNISFEYYSAAYFLEVRAHAGGVKTSHTPTFKRKANLFPSSVLTPLEMAADITKIQDELVAHAKEYREAVKAQAVQNA